MRDGECSQGMRACVSDAGAPGQRQAWRSGMGNWQYGSEETGGSHILHRRKEG